MSRTASSPAPSPHPLRALRDRRRLSLRALARLSGISYITLHHIEHGREISAINLAKLMKALKVDATELMPQERHGG